MEPSNVVPSSNGKFAIWKSYALRGELGLYYRSPLFRLPRELRDRIYEFALGLDCNDSPASRVEIVYEGNSRRDFQGPVALFLVSKRVSEEARGTFYTKTTFSFADNVGPALLESFLFTIGPDNCRMIRKLSVNIAFPEILSFNSKQAIIRGEIAEALIHNGLMPVPTPKRDRDFGPLHTSLQTIARLCKLTRLTFVMSGLNLCQMGEDWRATPQEGHSVRQLRIWKKRMTWMESLLRQYVRVVPEGRAILVIRVCGFPDSEWHKLTNVERILESWGWKPTRQLF
ncbi:hypothetical protein BDY21DRAFT_361833 [Lineolata rhizophorae]|uniref:Uncharacterized protein n=1 Tax=Lineolata rhizophorae TaxID=578093 RepID=A0A6A6P7Z2_9PEZI|nr:hypothetical protein BDY21DRAFT_361833 [Lineolata rhizophorae]